MRVTKKMKILTLSSRPWSSRREITKQRQEIGEVIEEVAKLSIKGSLEPTVVGQRPKKICEELVGPPDIAALSKESQYHQRALFGVKRSMTLIRGSFNVVGTGRF